MTATNSVVAAKDGSGNPFNLTVAAESISGNKAQKLYLAEPVGEALITPMQQTGGVVGLAGGTAAIGSIIGRTTMVTATPVVTSNGTYVAGAEIGGLMTFAIGGAGSGCLKSIRVTSKSIIGVGLTAYLFTTNPSNSAWVDNAMPAINVADVASLLCSVDLNKPANGLGTHTVWDASPNAQFVGANLYAVLIVTAPGAILTSTSTSDITVQLGVRDD